MLNAEHSEYSESQFSLTFRRIGKSEFSIFRVFRNGGEKMKALHVASYVLLWVGGLNWGLIGLFNFDLVNAVLGSMPTVEKLVYVLVGVATVYIVATHKNDCKVCGGK